METLEILKLKLEILKIADRHSYSEEETTSNYIKLRQLLGIEAEPIIKDAVFISDQN